MVIKLVVTDIDGTIVEFNSELKQETIDIFKALEQKGVKTVIATGRMYKATKNIVEGLGIKTPVICYQGAMIRDENEIYFEQNVPKKIARVESEYFLNPLIPRARQ